MVIARKLSWQMLIAAMVLGLGPFSSAQSTVAPVVLAKELSASATELPCMLPREEPRKARTWLRIMDARYTDLGAAIRGYQASGVPLVGLREGCVVALEAGDDQGIFYYIPRLALVFHVTVDHAIELTLGVPAAFATLIGMIGLWHIIAKKRLRYWALLGVALLALLVWRCGDTYVWQYVVVITIIPWMLYFWERKRAQSILCIVGGLFCGFASTVRSGAGSSVVVFLVAAILLTPRWTMLRRIAALIMLLVPFAVPSLWVDRLLHQRDDFLQRQANFHGVLTDHRAYWHSIYIGFGLLGNHVVPLYEDSIADQRVKSIDPTAVSMSRQYEAILRREVFRLAIEHPALVLASEYVKLSIVVMTLLVCANVGLLAMLVAPKDLAIEAAFWLAMAIAAVPSILVLPRPHYLLGFMTLAFMYGVLSIDHALLHRARWMPLISSYRSRYNGEKNMLTSWSPSVSPGMPTNCQRETIHRQRMLI